MGVLTSAGFSFQGRDGSHTIAARMDNNFTNVRLSISVDGEEIVNRKAGGTLNFWGTQHTLRIGQHAGLVKIIRSRGFQTRWELYVDGKPVPEGQHVVIEAPSAPAAPQVIYTQAPPQVVVTQAPAQPAAASTPVMPVLPPKCPNCGTPISMDSVQWTGPMSARCPACNNGIEVEWRKLGG